VLALLLALTGPAAAQLPGVFLPPTGSSATSEEDERTAAEGRLGLEEVNRLLLERGVSEDAARRLLADYPSDKNFTRAEVDALLRRIRPEDLRTRQESEERSPEEESLQLGPGAATGRLREPEPFGYDIFRRAPSTFEPEQDLAVGPDYRLGPGDEVKVSLWGSVQQDFFAVIDREGKATFPEIGPVSAAGLTLGDFEARLRQDFSRTFSGFRLAVSLGRLRRIQVVVAGDVVRPGAYFLSPVSNAFNAVYFAGGPTERGSLRRVRVVRDGALVAEVDLYRYLLEGRTDSEVKLLSGDTVFLMNKGPQVTLRGEVRRPAIFELLPGETVTDLLAMGGGFTAEAHPERVTLDRVSPVTGPYSIEIDLSPYLADSTFAAGLGRPERLAPAPAPEPVRLQDGDNLTIYSIYHITPREFVELQGMVQFPGIYPLYPGMRLSDLLYRGGGLLESAWLLSAELSRVAEPARLGVNEAPGDTVSRSVAIDLARVMASPGSGDDLVLQRNDKLYIRKIPGWTLQSTVKLSGEVQFPGIYPLLIKEERLSSVVERAGGLTGEAFLKGASLFRRDQGRVVINFEKALRNSGEREDIVLADGDSVHVPPFPPTIVVEGEVSRPAALLFEPGKNASYYVDRTGGVTDNGDRGATRIVRVDGVVEKAFKPRWWDPEVQPGSRIVVARRVEREGTNWGAVIRDSAAILASLATTVFVISEINRD
jgi:protein involved in polysaccharide export with SLBB domain